MSVTIEFGTRKMFYGMPTQAVKSVETIRLHTIDIFC